MGEIERIRERWSAITPGPWRRGWPSFACPEQHQHGRGKCVYRYTHWVDDDNVINVDNHAEVHTDRVEIIGGFEDGGGGVFRAEDTEAIAHAPADVATLLAAIEAAQAREAALEAEREGWRTVGVALLEYFGARDTLDAMSGEDETAAPFVDAVMRWDGAEHQLRLAFEAQKEAIGTALLAALAATAPDAGVGGA